MYLPPKYLSTEDDNHLQKQTNVEHSAISTMFSYLTDCLGSGRSSFTTQPDFIIKAMAGILNLLPLARVFLKQNSIYMMTSIAIFHPCLFSFGALHHLAKSVELEKFHKDKIVN